MIWASRVASRVDVFPQTLSKCLSTTLDTVDPELAPMLVSAYGLDISASSNTPHSTQAVLEFGNDITFSLPAYSMMDAWSKASGSEGKAFLYHFDCPNPWDGPWKGQATHGLDLMFVLQNYRDHLSEGQQSCGERFASDIITFVNGNDPWPKTRGNRHQQPMVYLAAPSGEKDNSSLVSDMYSSVLNRRKILQTQVREDYRDMLFDSWQMFMDSPTDASVT